MKIKCPQCKQHFEDMELCSQKKCFFDLQEMPTYHASGDPTEYREPEMRKVAERIHFEEKPSKLSQILRGRNLAGKVLYSVLGIIAYALGLGFVPSILIANFSIMELVDLSFIQLLIAIVGLGVSFAIGLYVKSPALKAKLTAVSEYLADELVKATDEASEQSKKVTRGEALAIVKGVLDRVFK